jgi:hypothetical protein
VSHTARKEPIQIAIDSTALGRRFVGRTHTKTRHHYTRDESQAIVLHDAKVAKDFCKTWAERTGNDFIALQHGREVFRARGRLA